MRAVCTLATAVALAACVPADEALGTGSVQFSFGASERTVVVEGAADGYVVRFTRVVLGFKTMTIGKIGVPETCSYRGRGALTNVVFDPRQGVVQTFNGIQPVECPDVGVIFGSPDNATALAEGVSSADLIELAELGAHAIVEATATPTFTSSGSPEEPYTVKLVFTPLLAATRFGGCREARRGITIRAGMRDEVPVQFAAENLFRDAISTTSQVRFAPFAQADAQGNNDHVVTMEELDELSLSSLFSSGFYQLPNGTRGGTLGDFVRVLFRFTVLFRTSDGICVGNDPESAEGSP